MLEERRIKIFLAGKDFEATRKMYLGNLERFCIFAKFDGYSELVKMKKMKIRMGLHRTYDM